MDFDTLYESLGGDMEDLIRERSMDCSPEAEAEHFMHNNVILMSHEKSTISYLTEERLGDHKTRIPAALASRYYTIPVPPHRSQDDDGDDDDEMPPLEPVP